ncbi:MAG: hypothetical protein ACYDAA_15945 [Syntrophales bacterium]
MKINPQDMSGVTQTHKRQQQPQSTSGRFDEFLEKALAPQSGQEVTSTGALPALQGLSSMSFAVPAGVDRAQTVNNINQLLNIMESYQNRMADPKASLKDAYPFVQQMEKKMAELIPTLESLPAADKLKDVLNRALVASTVEVIKFNRGDYV